MKLEAAVSLYLILGPFVGANDEFDPFLSQRISQLRQKSRSNHLPRKLSTSSEVETAQSFFLPFPEPTLYHETFKVINSGDNSDGVVSITSISISRSGTKIYYDHWEDGYESDPMVPTQTSTEIWGDADASNGCRPGITCTAANDVLEAGDAIVLENEVPLTHGAGMTTFFFDGGDNIQALYPVAITRGAYPEDTGSYMAGAVEVFDTMLWGKEYKIPLDQDTFDRGLDHFEYVELYMMADEDGTVIVDQDGNNVCTLQKGESCQKVIDGTAYSRGDTFTSDMRFQANLLTGDKNSYYELRWYSLRPYADWSSTYLSPVGDSKAETRICVYNPSDTNLNVQYQTNSGGAVQISIAPNDVEWTEIIPTGSACILTSMDSTDKFIAFSISDTVSSTGGRHYDWGFPVMPTKMLTSTALIGWAYGCTKNNCNGGDSRSVVWVAPYFENGDKDNDIATVNVDYDNDGIVDVNYDVNYLDILKLNPDDDPSGDQDLSGAVIYATKQNKPDEPVRIAVAYGQDGSLSQSGDKKALDLGTVVVPFPPIAATKSWTLTNDVDNNNNVNIGDTIKYIIEVTNVGPSNIGAHLITVFDTLDDCLEYQPDTTVFVDENDNSQAISSTNFPFIVGVTNPKALPQNELHKYEFEVKIGGDCNEAVPIKNEGKAKVWDQEARFEKTFDLSSTPKIPRTIEIPGELCEEEL